jgi:phosphonate degradation associated HDIG domain protein
MDIIDDLQRLYLQRGARRYEINGRDGVTQLQHALQCAAWAAGEGAPAPLVAAALLHDLGHLVVGPDDEMESDHDDVHQFAALPFLRPHFPPAVLEPIRLHVDAKRFLCGTDAAYPATLSAGSQRSLELQGGPFDAAQARRFLAQPFAADAVRLRRWDDRSKDISRAAPPFDTYRALLEGLRLAPAMPERGVRTDAQA